MGRLIGNSRNSQRFAPPLTLLVGLRIKFF